MVGIKGTDFAACTAFVITSQLAKNPLLLLQSDLAVAMGELPWERDPRTQLLECRKHFWSLVFLHTAEWLWAWNMPNPLKLWLSHFRNFGKFPSLRHMVADVIYLRKTQSFSQNEWVAFPFLLKGEGSVWIMWCLNPSPWLFSPDHINLPCFCWFLLLSFLSLRHVPSTFSFGVCVATNRERNYLVQLPGLTCCAVIWMVLLRGNDWRETVAVRVKEMPLTPEK